MVHHRATGSASRSRKWIGCSRLTVVIPTALAVLYYRLVRFRRLRFGSRGLSFAARTSRRRHGLGVLLKSAAGFSNAGDEIYAADEYIQSRDALQGAQSEPCRHSRLLRTSSISIFDRFNPLGTDGSFEDPLRLFRQEGPGRLRHDLRDHDADACGHTLRLTHRNSTRNYLAWRKKRSTGSTVAGAPTLFSFPSSEVQDAQEAARRQRLSPRSIPQRERDHRSGEAGRCPAADDLEAPGRTDRLEDAVAAASADGAAKSADPDPADADRWTAREIDQQLGLVAGNRRSLSADSSPLPAAPA